MFGFPSRMVNWIAECISISIFLVSINCEVHGFFPSGKGSRQGDHVLPYLFILAMKVFSGLIG
jgi:hypothetical protein